jgi:predicted porin
MFNLGEFSMKKTLVAIAALAAVSAFAQSSVTLYGRVDAGLFSQKTETLNAAGVLGGVRQTGINNGSAVGLTGSRWGMRGTEDLGGGLKAGFKIENRFNLDNGAGTQNLPATTITPATPTAPAVTAPGAPLLFGGEAFLSLSGGFGTVKVGRIFTAFDDLRAIAISKNNFDAAWTPVADAYNAGVAGYAARGDNAIKYESPSFGGISGALMYAFGENKTATLKAGSQLSAHVKYANGPLVVGLGLQNDRAGNGAKAREYTALSAAYDLGVVALSGGFNTSKQDFAVGSGKDSDREFSLGVTMPLGAAAVSAGYASSTGKSTGVAAKEKGSGFGLSATYSLSKRTTLYTGIKSTKIKTGNTTDAKDSLFSAGVRHDF